MNEQNSARALRAPASPFLTIAFTGAGLYIIGRALGIVPSDPNQMHAPRWVLVLVGGAFAFAGWLPVLSRADTGSRRFRIVTATVVLCMLAVVNWAALHPESGIAHTPMTPRPGLYLRLTAPGPVLRVVYLVVLDVALGALALWLLFDRHGRKED